METDAMDGANERRERKDAQRNMERVLRAAHALFAERGADVTMEEVARRAGVGVGTIYRRFPSKDHLFAVVSQTVCTDTRHCLQAAAQAEHDPLAKILALVFAPHRRVITRCGLIMRYISVYSDGSTLCKHASYYSSHQRRVRAAEHIATRNRFQLYLRAGWWR